MKHTHIYIYYYTHTCVHMISKRHIYIYVEVDIYINIFRLIYLEFDQQLIFLIYLEFDDIDIFDIDIIDINLYVYVLPRNPRQACSILVVRFHLAGEVVWAPPNQLLTWNEPGQALPFQPI